MRGNVASAIMAAAIGALAIGLAGNAVAQEASPPAGQGAAQPAAATDVPVKRVVLYTSGVGYFEHFGPVHGDGSTVLSFKTEQINDVLKSLLLEDLDGGRVAGVSYPTLAPLAQTLKSFQVDLTSDPPLADILKQLRGASVTVTLPTGPVTGKVLGVEQKPATAGAGAQGSGGVVQVWTINLMNDSGILPIELSKVTNVKLDDPQLAAEMDKALEAVAQARDKDKKPVTISFAGRGDHRVRIGYVVETPIWKASYRISLGEANAAGPADQKGPMAGVPANERGKIQGWAIVDNQTDNDWNGVELSLVSGRPISFIEDLYQPLYVPRPTVQPDLYIGLVPQRYDVTDLATPTADFTDAPDFSNNSTSNNASQNPVAGSLGYRAGHMTRQAIEGQAKSPPDSAMDSVLTPQDDIGGGRGIQALASGAKVGEAFQYTVHDVSLARQKSSMIPILSGPMQAQRLSIYNAAALPNNPLLGARLTNTSGGYIMQGPVTVLDHGIYAGDTQVLDMPPGATRLISYGVDQRMQIIGGDAKSTNQLLTGKIVKGVLQLSNEQVMDQTFTAKNKADAEKLLLIEDPRQTDWQLVQPTKPKEVTDALYRFELPVPAGKSASLEVRQQHVYWQAVEILPSDLSTLIVYSQNAAIPQPVKDALVKAITLKQAVAETARQVAQVQQDKSDLAAEQDRIRKDMQVVSPGTDYYKKLLKKLDDQETQFEQMESQIKQLDQQGQTQQKAFEDYLAGLSVG